MYDELVPDVPRATQDIHSALIDLMTDDEPSESNLAYHFATDEDFRVSVCEQAFARLSDSPEHPWEVAPWLEAGHEGDCGQIADMSQKGGGCVRSGGENVRETPDSAEITQEPPERGLECAPDDTREKLEADVNELCVEAWKMHPFEWDDAEHMQKRIYEFLDRQAAITEGECLVRSKQGADALYVIENAELQDKVDELTDGVSELLKKQPYTFNPHDVRGSIETIGRYIDELTAERDYWQGECDDMYQVTVDPLAEPLGYPNGRARPSTMVLAATQGRDRRIADLEAERDVRAGAADAAGRRVKELENELANMTGARDHWRRVAGKHAKEMQTLRRALKLEQERTVNELPEGVVWPHFEDGACVGFGDAFVGCDGEPHELACVKFLDDGYWMMKDKWDSGGHFGGFTSLGCGFWSYGETFERPPLLASDGQPIEVGQVYFGLSDGKAWEVEGFDRKRKWSVWAHDVENPEKRKCLKPEWLSRERPDSFNAIAGELREFVDTHLISMGNGMYEEYDELTELAERIEKLAKEGGASCL